MWRLASIVWTAYRPPHRSSLTASALLRRAIRRRLLVIFVVVPLGLALAYLMERYADHPFAVVVRKALGDTHASTVDATGADPGAPAVSSASA